MDNQSSGFSVRSNIETTDNISDEIRKGIRVCCLKAFDVLELYPGELGTVECVNPNMTPLNIKVHIN